MATKYEHLANILRSSIQDNHNNSYKLPTEQALCNRYGISRQTVRKALSILVEEGLIEKRQGSGSYAASYQPDTVENTIALLVHSDSEYLYPALIADIKNRLQDHNFTVITYVTNNSASKERMILQELLKTSIRGVICEPCKSAFPTPNKDLYAQLQDHDITILFFRSCYSNLMEFPHIQSDNYHGGYFLTQYLLNRHHSRIACFFQRDSALSIERHYGYACALRDINKEYDDSLTCWYDYETLRDLQTTQNTSFISRFLDHHLSTITAIVCENDELAYWICKVLRQYKISIPDDLSMVCFHNTYLNDLNDTPVTSLIHKPHEMAHLVADQMARLIMGRTLSNAKLTFHIIERGSVGAPSLFV